MQVSVMSTYWFKPREYGYGATPITWQGWAITVAAVIVVVLSSLVVPALANGAASALSALVIDVLAIAALVIVSRRKTDGEWRWRWGQR
jgi:hypothetical protein